MSRAMSYQDSLIASEPLFVPAKACDCPRCKAERIVAEKFAYPATECECCYCASLPFQHVSRRDHVFTETR